MRLRGTTLLLSVLVMSVMECVWAEEFTVIGARAMGMGGAGVATTRGALSTYWNPAALDPPRRPRVDRFFDLTMSLDVQGTATGDFLSEIGQLMDLTDDIDVDALADALEAGGAISDENLQDVLRLVEAVDGLTQEGTGLQTSVTPGLNMRFGSFGFSALGFVHGGGVSFLDLPSLSLGDSGIEMIITGSNTPSGDGSELASSLTDSLESQGLSSPDATRIANELVYQAEQAGANVSDPAFQALLEDVVAATGTSGDPAASADLFTSSAGFNLRGIALQEYALGYAISDPWLEMFSIGIAPKFLYGMTYFNGFTLDKLEDFGDLLDELLDRDYREDSMNFGLDIGVLAMPTDWLSLGVVGKNLNSPEFDFQGPGEYRLDPQVRAGIGVGPFAGFTLAADFDLIENHSSALPGYDSQVICGGLEYNLFDILMLRAGLSKNLAESEEEPAVHAGLGLRVFGISLDVAAMVGLDTTLIDIDDEGRTDELPEQVGASVMFSIFVPLQ